MSGLGRTWVALSDPFSRRSARMEKYARTEPEVAFSGTNTLKFRIGSIPFRRLTDAFNKRRIGHRNTFTANSCMTATNFDRITVDPKRMNGQPCIRGMRLTVRRVVEAVSLYPNREELFREYPELLEDDVRQALEFAAANLEDVIDFRVA